MRQLASGMRQLAGTKRGTGGLTPLRSPNLFPTARSTIAVTSPLAPGQSKIFFTNSFDVDLAANHRGACLRTDKPVAGLLRDLKQRGLLDSTLVIWGGTIRNCFSPATVWQNVSQDSNCRES